MMEQQQPEPSSPIRQLQDEIAKLQENIQFENAIIDESDHKPQAMTAAQGRRAEYEAQLAAKEEQLFELQRAEIADLDQAA